MLITLLLPLLALASPPALPGCYQTMAVDGLPLPEPASMHSRIDMGLASLRDPAGETIPALRFLLLREESGNATILDGFEAFLDRGEWSDTRYSFAGPVLDEDGTGGWLDTTIGFRERSGYLELDVKIARDHASHGFHHAYTLKPEDCQLAPLSVGAEED